MDFWNVMPCRVVERYLEYTFFPETQLGTWKIKSMNTIPKNTFEPNGVLLKIWGFILWMLCNYTIWPHRSTVGVVFLRATYPKNGTWGRLSLFDLHSFKIYWSSRVVGGVSSTALEAPSNLLVGGLEHFLLFPSNLLVGGLDHFLFFPYIGNVIIPTDELIFFIGVGIAPTSLVRIFRCWSSPRSAGLKVVVMFGATQQCDVKIVSLDLESWAVHSMDWFKGKSTGNHRFSH